MRRRVSSLIQDYPGSLKQSTLGRRVPLVSLVQALAVAEHLNFGHAASALGVSQSSVSTRIKQLEGEHGILLFERRHRGVRLTEAGRQFLEHVATGIEHLEHAVRTAGAVARGEQGRLRIGLYSAVAAGFLAELLVSFAICIPRSICRSQRGERATPFERFARHGLTSPLSSVCRRLANCRSKPLWREALLVALREGHPLTGAEGVRWRELAGEPFLARSNGAGPQVHDHIVLRLAEHWSQPRVHFWWADIGGLRLRCAWLWGRTMKYILTDM
jgi:DNA-binding transcriptional LysR family regulator